MFHSTISGINTANTSTANTAANTAYNSTMDSSLLNSATSVTNSVNVYSSGYGGSVYTVDTQSLTLTVKLHIMSAELIFTDLKTGNGEKLTHLSEKCDQLSNVSSASSVYDVMYSDVYQCMNSVQRDELCLHI